MNTTQNPTPSVYNIHPGDHVTGRYMGVPFTGTVTISRGHTINWNLYIIHVELDTPTDILGIVRTGISLDVNLNGIGDYDCDVALTPALDAGTFDELGLGF